MKKNRAEKNKSNVSTSKNPYCIALENAEKRRQGTPGKLSEYDVGGPTHPYYPR